MTAQDQIDHKAFLMSLSSDEKDRLTEKRNLAGLKHLVGHAGLILVLGALIAAKLPFWWLLMVPQGIAIAFLFTLQHECTHKTPFENEALNEWVGWAAGVAIFQPFLWFRYFHLAHHRHTNIPGQDPELAGEAKPENWNEMLWHLSCLGYWRDKVLLFRSNAIGRFEDPYLPKSTHGRLRQEARRMLVLYSVLAVFALFVWPTLIWVWLLPLAFGFPVLRLYLLAEHGRCAKVVNMFENTRTTFTNVVVRFLAWNMPYHVEHHVYPQVPFYRLAEFHRVVQNHLRCTSDGYREFACDYVRTFE